MINFDYSALLSMYQLRAGVGSAGLGGAAPAKKGPVAPWSPSAGPPEASERVKAALENKPILDVEGAKKKLPKTQEDYAELFALYNAFDTMKALAARMDAKDLPKVERSKIQRVYNEGLTEVNAFLGKMDFDKFNLIRGMVTEKLGANVRFVREKSEYRTGIVHRGAADAEVAAMMGDVRFSMTVRLSSTTTTTINFDLAEMGTEPRQLSSVVSYLNSKLEAAGALTRFSREKLPAEVRTVKAGSTTVTLPDGPDRWALKISGVSTETLSFAAPDRADAVYLAQTVGKDGAATRQMAKFQTDAAVGAPPPALQTPGEANWVEGRVFAKPMAGAITAVRASATHADGSVYMLAEVEGAIANQTLKAERDVALLKYDATGALVFSRTLGASGEVSASAIAVSADGKVAIGGSLKGELGGVAVADTRNLDSFVSVYDSEGDELWTRRGGSFGDDDVRSLTFGADGVLYASGKTQGPFAADSAIGGADAWLRAYRTFDRVEADGSSTPDVEVLFTSQYGTTAEDVPTSIAVEGNVLVAAGVENGRAIVRRFDLQASGPPVQSATTDLGALVGGRIAGVSIEAGKVTVAGSTSNANLSAATQLAGHSGGGHDVFMIHMDQDLSFASSSLTYWGGAGDDQLTAVSMRGAEVYVTGSSTADIGALTALGAKDGFVARLNAATGAQEWARRFTGKDGEVAPSAIAVGRGGASVLDRLGLPQGAIDYTGSQRITAGSAARVGDRFFVKVGANGRETAITVEAEDTLKSLALKVNRALRFYGTARVVRDIRPVGATDGSEAPFAAADRLQITPRNNRNDVYVRGGEGSRDLLRTLGLSEGVARQVTRDRKGEEIAPRGGKTYGLQLARDLSIDTPANIKRTVAEFDDAITVVQSIYRDLTRTGSPDNRPLGDAPAHLLAQLANYQAGLARLSGSG